MIETVWMTWRCLDLMELRGIHLVFALQSAMTSFHMGYVVSDHVLEIHFGNVVHSRPFVVVGWH